MECRYSQRLNRFSVEAVDFVQSCLICNPKYRLGSEGIHELLQHPWFADVNWDAMRAQSAQPPFLPDTRRANCSITDTEAASIMMNEEEAEAAPPIAAADQAKFIGFDYRVLARGGNIERGDEMAPVPPGSITVEASGERAPTVSMPTHAEQLNTHTGVRTAYSVGKLSAMSGSSLEPYTP
ncbi:hypothetical protein EON66_05350, partial [archaeon]